MEVGDRLSFWNEKWNLWGHRPVAKIVSSPRFALHFSVRPKFSP